MNNMILPSLDGDSTEIELSPRQKAAVVVRLLLQSGAVPALASLSEEAQTNLAVQLARMPRLQQSEINSVAGEFADAIEQSGMSFPDGIDAALGMLDGVISQDAKERLRALSSDSFRSDPWPKLCEQPANTLLPFIEREAETVAAVILSRIKVATAAEVLGLLPGDTARKITLTMSRIGGASALVVEKIGRSILDQIQSGSIGTQSNVTAERVGAILNQTRSKVRNIMLDSLDKDDPPFASQVRSNIFTFSNIPQRLRAKDMHLLQRDVELNDLAIVISGAEGKDEEAVEFILSNISIRMAQNLRDEAESLDDIPEETLEASMANIVEVVRSLEENGELKLLTPVGSA